MESNNNNNNNNMIPLAMPGDQIKYGVNASRNPALHNNNNNNNNSNTNAQHPLHQSLNKFDQFEMKRKYFTMSHVYGQSMPVHFEMEKMLVQQPLRLPGLPSSSLAMDLLNDKDESIEFEDWLQDNPFVMNSTQYNESVPLDLHLTMEHQLNMKEVRMI